MESSFFSTNGRLNRQVFIIRSIILLSIIFSSLYYLGQHSNQYHPINDISDISEKNDYMYFSLFILFFIIAFTIQIIKRLHDLELSGFYILIAMFTILIPYIGLLVFLISLILLFSKDGSKGKNKFGNDPLGREKLEDSDLEKLSSIVKKTSTVAQDFISKKYERIEKNSEIKYSLVNLKGANWTLLNDIENTETTYIFRDNNELLISINGLITKANYEFIIDNNSILITKNDLTEIYNIILMKDDLLLINKFSSDEVFYFGNKTKFKDFAKNVILARAKSYENINNR